MAIPHRLHGQDVPTETAPAKRIESDPESLTDADAIADRVIAHYNLERRRAGEVPLDLKGADTLHRLIAEEIERFKRSNGANAADVH